MPKWLNNGWTKFCGACLVVATGFTVGVCNLGFSDWHGYSGIQQRVTAVEARAAEAKAEAENAKEKTVDNRTEIAALKATVHEINDRGERMERNLYQFLSKQPGLTPVAPPAEEGENP